MTTESSAQFFPHLLIMNAEEEEDEEALKTVEDREDVGHGNSRFTEVEESKSPSQSQKEDENKRSFNPSLCICKPGLFFALHNC